MNASSMCFTNTFATIFGMSQRNQVMHHEDGADAQFAHCPRVSRELHSRVTGVQQDATRNRRFFHAVRSALAPSIRIAATLLKSCSSKVWNTRAESLSDNMA